ncbi:MAG: hypothetical protein JSS07_08950 [Proteobacteria bacterium]|nr:hypothetical protein [Pseudomonadota bacterium]
MNLLSNSELTIVAGGRCLKDVDNLSVLATLMGLPMAASAFTGFTVAGALSGNYVGGVIVGTIGGALIGGTMVAAYFLATMFNPHFIQIEVKQCQPQSL